MRLCRQLFFQQKTLAKLVREYTPIIPATLGEHIMNKRKMPGLHQKDIAPLLGVMVECISFWERRASNIRVVYYPRIAKFLGYEWWQCDTSTIGGRIQDYRYRHGLRAKDFAKLIGVEFTTVRSWERGLTNPLKQMVIKINVVLENTKPLD